MRKKFLSAFMLGALALGATSTIVSCKDYDGDISELRQDINSLDATLKSEIQSVKDQLAAQKSELETKIANAQATLQAAIDKKADKTTVEALAKQVADLEKELGVVNSRLNTIDATLAEVNAAIADLKANKADKTEVAELRLFVETELAAIKGDISGLQTAVKEILADIAGIKGDINGIKGDISDLQKKDIELFAAINQEALDRAAAISALDKELSAKIKTVADNLAAFIAEQTEFNDAVITEISNINGALVNIAGQIEALQMVDEGLDNRITALETRLQGYEGVVADLRQAQKDIAALQKDVKKAFEDIATNAANIEANAKAIDALSQRVTTEVQTLDSKISAVDAKVNALTVCVTKRLTSIYFAPSTFVDGVECIDFASLNYIDWGTKETDWLANYAPENGVENRIDDGTTTAVYYLNPSGVDEESIENGVRGLSFISNTASNITTRGAATPVVSVKSGEIKDGKLTLQLTKNSAAINNSNEKFTIVSLKAPLSEKVKTASEKGKEINVYSDWARLTESVVRPFIHNKKALVNGKVDERAEFAHFYRFGDIYSKYSPTFSGIQALNYTQYTSQSRDSKIKFFCAYDKTFDVKELTTVCDYNGNEINYESYGLAFEYNLMSCYWVLNEGATTDATNQQLYATINDGVVASAAPGVSGANRAAIGKSPVVQIVLRDTKNNAVVDVKYIMIQWLEKDVEVKDLEAINKQTTWDCGEIATCKIGESELNKIAAQLNLETVVEFSSRFTVSDVLVDAADKKIGVVDKKENGQADGQIDNILVTFEVPMAMTKDLYENGSVAYTGYVKLISKTEPLEYRLPVVLTATFDKSRQLKLNSAYVENAKYWTGEGINRYVVANPTLEANDATDTYTMAKGYHDTQILYNLLNAYLKGTVAPENVENLVLNLQKADGDNARFVFDEERVPEVLGDGWSVSADGTTLYFRRDVAATITRNGFVQLEEGPVKGKHGLATEAAKMLVAYDETPATEATKNAVPVKIVGTLCDYDVVLSQFLVRFEKPLNFAWGTLAVTLKDQMSAGWSETLSWNKIFSVKEAYGRTRPIVDTKNNDKTLRSWYGYYWDGKNDIYPYININEAKLDGKYLSSYKNADGLPMYELKYEYKYDKDNYGENAKFTFYNNSGNAITEDLTITVPVTVETKWRTWENTVTVTVSQTTTTAKRR